MVFSTRNQCELHLLHKYRTSCNSSSIQISMNVNPVTMPAMNMHSAPTVMEVSVVSAWRDTQGMATVAALVRMLYRICSL